MVDIIPDAIMQQAEQAARQAKGAADKAQSDAANNLRNTLAIRHESDGSARIPLLNIKIPKAIAPWIEGGYDTFIAPLTSKLGDKTFEGAYRIGRRFGHSELKAQRIGSIAKLSSALALLLSKPATKLVTITQKYHGERQEMAHEFLPVTEATGANAGNNEVIRFELNRVHNHSIDELKSMGAELPMLAVQSLYVMDSHGKSNSKKLAVEIEGKLAAKTTATAANVEKIMAESAVEAARLKAAAQQMLARDTWVDAQLAERKKIYEASELYGAEVADRLERYREAEDRLRADFEKQYSGKHSVADPEAETEVKSILNKLGVKNTNTFLAVFAGVSQTAQVAMQDGTDTKKKQSASSAWQMIKNLRNDVLRQYREDKDNSCGFVSMCAEDIMIEPLDKQARRGEMNLTQYIVEIFQQHEREMGRGEIKTNSLQDLEAAAGVIADAIADGGIDGYALVNLVGDGRIVGHSSGKRTVVSVKDVEAEVARLKPMMGLCAAADPKEFFARFEQAGAMQEALRTSLREMHGIEKASFAAMFSDSILKAAGMNGKEVAAVRRQAHGHMSKIVDAGVREFSSKTREELQKLEIGEDDINRLKKLKQELEVGNTGAIDFIVKGHGRDLVQNVLGVVALKELVTDKDAWSKRLKAIVAPQQAEKTEQKPETTKSFADAEKKHGAYTEHALRPQESGPAVRL